jgi:hypothetical protein
MARNVSKSRSDQNHTVPSGPVPEALIKEREKDAREDARAKAWVRTALEAFFATDAGFEPRTSREIMGLLDRDMSMPGAYARLAARDGDVAAYNKRYQWVRNALEAMSRKKLVVTSQTLNKFERESATYARPRDASAEWSIEIDTTDNVARMRALNGIKQWLQLDGAVLQNVKYVRMFRKPGVKQQYEQAKATEVPGRRNGGSGTTIGGIVRKPRGRKPRITQGSD